MLQRIHEVMKNNNEFDGITEISTYTLQKIKIIKIQKSKVTTINVEKLVLLFL